MDIQILKIVGEVAGIGGLGLGVFLLLFKDLLKKIVAPKMSAKHWFRVVVLFMFLVWSVAVWGIGAWVYAATHQSREMETAEELRAGLVPEAQNRVRRFRQQFSLCRLRSTFLVDDKIKLIEQFDKQVAALDECVNPRYKQYGFRALVSELPATSDKMLSAFARLLAESAALRQYLSAYQMTPNDKGGAEFLYKSEQQLIKLVKLVNELRVPWPKEVEPFPEECVPE